MPTTYRCTKNAFRLLELRPRPDPPDSTGVLGDWYVNAFGSELGAFVMFTSEATLLSVVIPFATPGLTLNIFEQRLAQLLGALGIPDNVIEREMNHLQPWAFAKTQNRRVLGSMNDFINQLLWGVEDGHVRDLESILTAERQIAKSPMRMIGYSSPEREVRKALLD